ncbi:hypothetical protein [Microbacterium sp. NPDC057650]|uniref:hypothetical protein n=1 Tax=unclassified Microbacterium TaxID=2609290 RepID=UPI0036722E32
MSIDGAPIRVRLLNRDRQLRIQIIGHPAPWQIVAAVEADESATAVFEPRETLVTLATTRGATLLAVLDGVVDEHLLYAVIDAG